MKKTLLIIPIIIAYIFLFHPVQSNSNNTGSPGGKTGSPNDNASCTNCHYAGNGNGATITSNIPSTGYIPNQVYTITANINQSGINKFGFEITSEQANSGSSKIGTFFVTDNIGTKLINNNTAITHKPSGTSATNSKSWSMDWEAPSNGSGPITFYAAFLAANGDGNNSGDTYHSTTYTVNEATTNSIIDENLDKDFIFYPLTKTILSNITVSLFDIKGRLILETTEYKTDIADLKKGVYILKSNKRSEKIFLN